jgi:hypothetical protein
MDDNEIYMIIENIIENLKIIRTMHEDSIYVSKSKFEEVERNLIGRLVQEIDKKLKEIILNEEVDFLKDIKGHYYNVCSVCRYEDWPEFKEYLKYIDGPFYDGGLNIKEFLRSSFVKYKFPVEYIFDYYDNGWIRIKLAEFISKDSGKVFGSSYEDYRR